MCESPYISVLADESTDRTVLHRLIIYVQILQPVTLKIIIIIIKDRRYDNLIIC